MKPDLKFILRKRKKLTTVLGLVLDGAKLDGVVLRRANGALQKLQSFSAPLTLDLLTAAPELAGREIRNQLDAAGVRERDCVVGVPLKWILTAQTELPSLPEADATSLLQLEAEKNFHANTSELQMADSRSALADGKKFVLLAGIPGAHIRALEQVLAAAKLKPVSLATGLAALQPAGGANAGTLALLIGETSVGLQVTAGGGVVALRALEGMVENEGGRRTLHADGVAREARVTLGQLPVLLQEQVKQIRIFGPRELAQQLADELELRFEPMGLKVEIAGAYAPNEFGFTLPPEASLSPAFSLAARVLAEQRPAFEFLPPKPTLIEQFFTKYSSGRWRTAGAVGAGVGVIVLGLFLFQQIQLWHLGSQWKHMEAQVTELHKIEGQISQYQSWYAANYRSLAILRELSLAFPQEGTVTAKLISIRDDGTVSCSGSAQDNASLLPVLDSLSKLPGVTKVHYEQGRGSKPPIQFVFSFNFNGDAQ